MNIISANNENKKETLRNISEYILSPFVVFYDDMLLENDLVKYILGSDFEKKNILFTTNNIDKNINIKADKYGCIKNILLKNSKNHIYTDIFRISDIDLFKEIINKDNYYDLINELELKEASIEYFYFSTNDYEEIILKEVDYKKTFEEVTLVDINTLKRIEDHDPNRALKLKDKIIKDNSWIFPIIVEANNNLILDGHHRFEVAKQLKLDKIPAILVDYKDIKVWSLRDEIKISKAEIVEKIVKRNEIYPYKTIKHKYSFQIPEINFNLRSLKND